MAVASADVPRVAASARWRSSNPFVVDAPRIGDYSRAIGDSDPLRFDTAAAAARGYPAVVAPPTFATVIWMRAEEEALHAVLPNFRADRVLHADRTLDIARPLLAGDRVGCEVRFESIPHYRDYDAVAVTTTMRDSSGTVVSVGASTLLVRPAACGAGRLPSPERTLGLVAVLPSSVGGDEIADSDRVAAHRAQPIIDFSWLRVGLQLPVRHDTLSSADLRQHARVVGADRPVPPPRSTQPATATPGMLGLGRVAGYLSSWLGDPNAVTRYRIQYSPGLHYLPIAADARADIEYRGHLTWLNVGRRSATVAVHATAMGRKLFRHVTAEARFA